MLANAQLLNYAGKIEAQEPMFGLPVESTGLVLNAVTVWLIGTLYRGRIITFFTEGLKNK